MNDKSMLFPAIEYNNLKELIQETIKSHSENTAFILKHTNGGQVDYEYINYDRFGKDIEAFGTALLKRGYAGKRVSVVGKNSYPWIVAYFAGLNSGCVVVPLDKGLPFEELESCLVRGKTDVILFDNEHLEFIDLIKEKNNTNISLMIAMSEQEGFLNFNEFIDEGKAAIESGDQSFSEVQIDANTMSLVLFTSGTTSQSKAVMLSHRNLASNIYALTCCEEVFQTDINMAFLPFHHTFSSTGITFMITKGITNVFCDGLKYIAQNLKEYKVSVFICVPLILEAIYKKIFQQAKKQGKEKLLLHMLKLSNFLMKLGIDLRRKFFKSVIESLGGSLRFVISGAAAISPEVAKGFNDMGILTIQGYGLTETAPVLTAENVQNIRTGSVGVPMCNVTIDIFEPGENGIGEVIAQGPNVMLGYYENEEETAKVLKDGWFYTGDLGYIDEDGFLFLCGRKKNVIVLKNGKNVYPEELEILLNNIPYLEESMVFGWIKGDDYVISAKLVYKEETVLEMHPEIKKESGLDVNQLQEIVQKEIDQINERVPAYKHIKRIVLSDEPTTKTTTAKIKRFEEVKKIQEQATE
ncbi:MAG: long-chain fatty acid--CoA ligase [Clostridia bacterium]|nr:long-chain fatty acid--CoA ligase [Clostridia bacterium]